MIKDEITGKIIEAVKAHEELRANTLRMLSSALNYEKIAKMHDLSEDEELSVVKREIKKRKDAVEMIKVATEKNVVVNSGPTLSERLSSEEAEIKVLSEFLPEQMSDEELVKIVEQVISEVGASTVQDMGKVIGKVMQIVGAKADGGSVSRIVKEKLL